MSHRLTPLLTQGGSLSRTLTPPVSGTSVSVSGLSGIPTSVDLLAPSSSSIITSSSPSSSIAALARLPGIGGGHRMTSIAAMASGLPLPLLSALPPHPTLPSASSGSDRFPSSPVSMISAAAAAASSAAVASLSSMPSSISSSSHSSSPMMVAPPTHTSGGVYDPVSTAAAAAVRSLTSMTSGIAPPPPPPLPALPEVGQFGMSESAFSSLNSISSSSSASSAVSSVTGATPYRCQICNYDTLIARNLRIHMTRFLLYIVYTCTTYIVPCK